MFERYTEGARRVVFFSRYEARNFGSAYIETEHLLLGLLREEKVLIRRLLRIWNTIPFTRTSLFIRSSKTRVRSNLQPH